MFASLLTAAVLTAAPPHFEWAWVDPSSRWDVPAGHGAEIALGALVGGFIGDVHPAYVVAVAAVETGFTFNPHAQGDRGRSLGLCQIQLRTARQELPWLTQPDLLRPGTNVFVAAIHLGRLIRLYGRAKAPGYYGCGYDCGLTRGSRAKWRVFLTLRG